MALIAEVVTFTSPASTGTQAHALSNFGGAIPKVAIIWTTQQTADGNTTDCLFGIGFATSATNRATVAISAEDGTATFEETKRDDDTHCIMTSAAADGAIVERADLDSFSADTVTFDWETVSASAIRYHMLVLGGDELEANIVEAIAPTSTGNVSYPHGLSGEPTALFAISDAGITTPGPTNIETSNGAMSIQTSDITDDRFCGADTGFPTHAQTDKFLSHANPGFIAEECSVTSVDSTNINCNWNKANLAEYHHILCLRGVVAKVGDYNSPASADTVAIDAGFPPLAFLTWGFMNTASTITRNDARMTFGATDGTTNACAGFLKQDNTDHRFIDGDEILQVYDHAQALEEEAAASFSGDNINVVFASAVAQANEFQYLALGSGTGGPPTVVDPNLYVASSTANTTIELIVWKTP